MTDDTDLAAIRQAVGGLCAQFPGTYWRELDRERVYPAAFVQALTDEGFLGVLIPEEYGGAACAILQEIHRCGCNAAAAHAQMYTMGVLLKHGGPEQKRRWLPKIAAGEIRLQAFGMTEPGAGSDTLSLSTMAARDGA